MSLFKKAVVLLLALSVISLNFPQICYCWQKRIYAKEDTEKGVTKHNPEFLATRSIKIPIGTEEPDQLVKKKKKNKWLWVGLGVLAAGVLAGAGGGGDGGDSGGGDNTGSIDITGPAP